MKVLYYGEANLVYQQMTHVDKSIKELFNKAGIDFVQPENEGHCAEGLAPFGFVDEAERQARMFLEAVEKSDADIVVTPYAASYSGWVKENPEKFGLSLPIPNRAYFSFFSQIF